MKTINKILENKKLLERIFLFGIFVLMIILNFLTPLIADDYSYSASIDGGVISSFFDIIKNQFDHYMTWGGRSVAHTIAQIFLILLNKNIFNVINAFVFTALVGLIYKNSIGANEQRPILIPIIGLLMWYFVPVFGQTSIWLIGSCNYLWTATFVMLNIYLFRNEKIKNNTINIILMFLLGVLAGWSNENTGFGCISVLVMFLIVKKFKKEKIHGHQISSLLGTILGYVVMLVAPGNYVRNEYFYDGSSFIVRYLKHFMSCTSVLYNYVMPLIIIVIVALAIILYKEMKLKNNYYYIFFIASMITIYVMIASPYFPERACFGASIFMITSCISLINLIIDDRLIKYVIVTALIIASIYFVKGYARLSHDILEYKNVWKTRIEIINTSKQKGIYDFEFGSYYTTNKRSPIYGLGDLQSDPDLWPNTSIANYYGINSIK
nr:hypothetical protein [Bacilli bacterium]